MSLSFTDLAVSFGINIAFVAIFLIAYAILSTQPANARVFYTKWFCIDDKVRIADVVLPKLASICLFWSATDSKYGSLLFPFDRKRPKSERRWKWMDNWLQKSSG